MPWFDDSPDLTAEPFAARLRATLERWPAPGPGARVTVAFSGGVDSTVLLAALARRRLRAPLRAVYVDHGLHPDSAAWGEHCAGVAAELGVAFAAVRVTVPPESGLGLEGAAREAEHEAGGRVDPAELEVHALLRGVCEVRLVRRGELLRGGPREAGVHVHERRHCDHEPSCTW